MIPFSPFPNMIGGFIGRNFQPCEELSLLENLVHLKQIHSDQVRILEDEKEISQVREMEGDALITALDNIPIAIKVADCVPILIAHPKGVIAAVHSGWRGSESKILQKTFNIMKEKWHLNLTEAFISIGPAICGKCYEVGEEVAGKFKNYGTDLEPVSSVIPHKYLLDLKNINLQMAEEVGIASHQIEIRRECTLCDEKNFYSYRGATQRGEKNTGRNFGWIKRRRLPQSPGF